MSFDEEARQSAEALAASLGREIQDRVQEFVSHLASAAADERRVLIDQAQQAVSATERTLEAAISRAREEAASDAAARDAEQAERLAEHSAAADRALGEAVARARDEAASEAAARHEADLADRDAAAEREALERQTAEREAMLAAMERLVVAFRRLDEGQSLSQLLDVLAEEAARETHRSAVFVVRGRSLQGWAFSGFETAPADARSVSLSLDAVPDFSRAIERGVRAEIPHTAFDEESGAPFLSLRAGDVGVAIPVSVGGQVAALVYADDAVDGDRQVPASWPEAIELLARHAARCLEAQTAIRAARLANGAPASAQAVRSAVGVAATAVVASAAAPSTPDPSYAEEHARRYARLLISDVRLKNETAVRLGREQRDLCRRLQPELDGARQSYNERVAAALLNRDRIFEEELVRTLADGDEALLGFDQLGPPAHAERVAV